MCDFKLKAMLGNTDVEISRLGLGGHTFQIQYGGMERACRRELLDIVNTAIEEGINFFDVTYDEEQKLLSSLLKELKAREQVFLSCWMSKHKTQTPAELEIEAIRVLALMNIDCVDLFYLDWTCTSEQVEAMVKLRKKGLTRWIGLLGTETALESDLDELDVVLVNHNYYWRDREPAIRQIHELYPDLGMVSLEPLGRGRFALDNTDGQELIVSACLKYALSFSCVHSVLVAVRRLSQLHENIKIWKSDLKLSDAESAALAAGRGYQSPD